jgi:glutamate dehydrogenase/leucine dehydrogenase
MEPFPDGPGGGHEQVVLCNDPESGLRAIIAIHSTVLGPALGGVRQWAFASAEEAVADARRLAQAMSYKAAVAGLAQGGGKAVVIGAPGSGDERQFRALGRFIDGLDGRYVAAEDVGTSPREMQWLNLETPWVTGIPVEQGGSGDPSPLTAIGVLEGMRSACGEALGSPDLAGRTVVVQGCGHVGAPLVRLLLSDGARVECADIDAGRAAALEREGATAVPLAGLLERPCDVLAPCALGGALTAEVVPLLRCRVICGAANNQLAQPEVACLLAAREILWAPDYVVNAGGIVNIYEEFTGYDPVRAEREVRRIGETTRLVLERARSEGMTPAAAADAIAEERIAAGRRPGGSLFGARRRREEAHPVAGLERRGIRA